MRNAASDAHEVDSAPLAVDIWALFRVQVSVPPVLPLYDVSLCMPFFRSVTNYRLEILHGYDVNPRADPWTFVHDSETGRVERSLGYTGILPLPCIEECAEDLNCHGAVPPPPVRHCSLWRFLAQPFMPPWRVGFVTFQGLCYFRAGKANSAEQVISAKIPCEACGLYVILRDGEHGLGHALSATRAPDWSSIPGEADTGQALSGLSSALSGHSNSDVVKDGTKSIDPKSRLVSLVGLALVVLCACACVAWGLRRTRQPNQDTRDWKRLPDDPSAPSAPPRATLVQRGSKDFPGVNPESNLVPLVPVSRVKNERILMVRY